MERLLKNMMVSIVREFLFKKWSSKLKRERFKIITNRISILVPSFSGEPHHFPKKTEKRIQKTVVYYKKVS